MKRDRLEDILNEIGTEKLPADVQKLAEQTSEDFSQALIKSGQPKHYNIGDYIMKSGITKLAAAAVIILAVLIGIGVISTGKSSITFAQVVEPILRARTIAYDFIIGDEASGTVVHDIVVDSKIRREMPSMAMTMVMDVDSGNMLVLNADKTAAYIDIQGSLQERTQSYIRALRQIITNNKDNYRQLGESVIDGREAVGFEAGGPNENVRIWADPETALPIRIELGLGRASCVLNNFELDFPVDESVVSMDVPPGYTFKESNIELGNSTEQDFVESLRIWAEVLNDGVFPDAIGTENAMKAVPVLGEKLGQMNISEQEATQMGMSFARGMLFYQTYETRNEGQYAGAGVRLGDADTPVFWYQPEGSQNYHVIYGDLSVREVAPGDLP